MLGIFCRLRSSDWHVAGLLNQFERINLPIYKICTMEYQHREISKKIKTLAYTVSGGSTSSRLECVYQPWFDSAERKNQKKCKSRIKRSKESLKICQCEANFTHGLQGRNELGATNKVINITTNKHFCTVEENLVWTVRHVSRKIKNICYWHLKVFLILLVRSRQGYINSCSLIHDSLLH